MYLCMVSSEGSTSSTKDQLCRNSTCTMSSCQKKYLYRGYVQQYMHRESVHQISCLYKHAQQQFNRMHVYVTLFVSVCTIITRQFYCMQHTCIAIWYEQVYCVLECMGLCHYDDVQVHVCNNASVCTSVSQHERMHVHALCVS